MIFLVSGEFEFNPKYDDLVWSGMCYLKEIGKDYSIGGFDMSIVSKNGKYGFIQSIGTLRMRIFMLRFTAKSARLNAFMTQFTALIQKTAVGLLCFRAENAGLFRRFAPDLISFLNVRKYSPAFMIG